MGLAPSVSGVGVRRRAVFAQSVPVFVKRLAQQRAQGQVVVHLIGALNGERALKARMATYRAFDRMAGTESEIAAIQQVMESVQLEYLAQTHECPGVVRHGHWPSHQS